MRGKFPKTRTEILERALAQKAERESQRLSFEEKLEVLVLLQRKAFAMGKTRIPPWPIASTAEQRSSQK